MSRERPINESYGLTADPLTKAQRDRLYEYRLAPRNSDLRKASKSRRSRRRKDSYRHSDPTAIKALRRVVHSVRSEGY